MGRSRHSGETAFGKHRRLRLLVGLLALSLVAAGCGGDDEEPTTAGPGQTGDQAAAPSGPQELRVGYAKDPWVDASEGDKKRKPNYPLNADVCDTLVQLAPDFSVVPMATRAQYIGNNTFRFTLVDGVKFADGTPVTSADLKYSVDYTVQAPSIGTGFLGPDSTKIVDDRSIDVTPRVPNLRLIEQINHPSTVVLKPGSDPLNNVLGSVCTGPFKVERYTPEQELVVVRNPNYWGPPARLDRITFRFYPDDTTRALALRNNEVDMITDIPLNILNSVSAQPDVKIAKAPVGFTNMFYIARRTASGEPKLLNDPVLRRAVAHSIDRNAYVRGVLGGNAEPIPHVQPPAVLGPFANMVRGIPFDRNEANRLLDQAGWTRQGDGVRAKDGQPLRLRIIYDRLDLVHAEFVQAQLRAVGFDAQIAQLDAGGYRAAQTSGDFDLDISQPNQNDGNPAFLIALRWYSQAGGGANNAIIAPGAGTRFDSMIDAILTETDPTELKRKSAEAMHELVDNEIGGVVLAGGYRVYALKNKVNGFEPHPSSTNQRWRTVFLRN
ncbi:MAG: ABC transporter substrate-binding protein [Actinomycetota bacterium]|nr:ABC transporter substrate-binding protein [Actinomycetota bacterium]